MKSDLELALDRQTRVWRGIPEPERSEMLSLFAERLVTDPHLPTAYVARKVKAEVFRQKMRRSREQVYEMDSLLISGDAEQSVIISEALDHLHTEERDIVVKLYMKNESLQEVAADLGLTVWRVRVLRDKALSGLRRQLDVD